jgi:diaminopimelate decarboxylase
LAASFGESAGTVYYAGKSFLCREITRWLAVVGIGLDVCSGGELAVAHSTNFPMSRVQVHGNNKSESEIRTAIESEVATIVVDSFHEIERVGRIAKDLGKVQRILLRLTAGVEAHTHEFISTAHEDVKFGFSIASGAAWRAITEASSYESIELCGFHSHIGSQIFVSDGFAAAAAKVIALCGQYRDEFNRELPELDLGGGYGIAYLPHERTLVPSEVLAELAAIVRRECQALGLAVPKISIEPGRAIVGPTTTTLYTVGTVKDVQLEDGHTRRYLSVDGGMSDNIRPALYDAEYHAILANRTSSESTTNTRVVGKHCESGDIVIREIGLQSDIGAGDLLAIPATGAYGRSMASNYNHLPRPSVVAVIDGKATEIVRRETLGDLLRLDL